MGASRRGSAPGSRESVLWPHCPSAALLVGSEPSQTQRDGGSFRRGRKPGLLRAGARKVRRPSDNSLGLPFPPVGWLLTLCSLVLPLHAASTPSAALGLLPAETELEQKALEFPHKPNLQTRTAPFRDVSPRCLR